MPRSCSSSRREHVLRRSLRVVFVQCARIRGIERVGDALGHFLYVHLEPSIGGREGIELCGVYGRLGGLRRRWGLVRRHPRDQVQYLLAKLGRPAQVLNIARVVGELAAQRRELRALRAGGVLEARSIALSIASIAPSSA